MYASDYVLESMLIWSWQYSSSHIHVKQFGAPADTKCGSFYYEHMARGKTGDSMCDTPPSKSSFTPPTPPLSITNRSAPISFPVSRITFEGFPFPRIVSALMPSCTSARASFNVGKKLLSPSFSSPFANLTTEIPAVA